MNLEHVRRVWKKCIIIIIIKNWLQAYKFLLYFSGIPTYLLINVTDLAAPGRLTNLELLNLHGDVLLEMPIIYNASSPYLYNISAFMPPAGFFFLKVRILIINGYVSLRTIIFDIEITIWQTGHNRKTITTGLRRVDHHFMRTG